MKTTISIIIPVYNVEQYIISCLRSVVCETVSGERLAVSGVKGEGERVKGEGGASRGLTLNVERTFSCHPDDCKEEGTRMMAEGTLHPSPFTLHPSPFTLHDIEVIIVDDCGTDNSIALAEEYLQGIPGLNYRILHHTHNRGLSAARNTGLAAAQGEYVYFLDSDDEMLPGALETLLQPLKDVKYDLVVGDYVEMKGEGKRVKGKGSASRGLTLNDECTFPCHPDDCKEEGSRMMAEGTLHPSPFTLHPLSMLRLPTGPVMGNEEILKGYATGKWYVMAWNKLCRREFLIANGLWFEEGLLHEDVVWTFKVACKAEVMYVAKVPTYFYRTREASIMTGMSMDKDAGIYVEAMDKIAEFVRTEGRTENRWEYHKMVGDTSRVLYSLLQRGETGLYAKYYPMFHRQCYVSPWKAYQKGIIGLGYLVRDLHYLMPMKWGRMYKKWFYNICYRMRSKRIEGAVWD